MKQGDLEMTRVGLVDHWVTMVTETLIHSTGTMVSCTADHAYNNAMHIPPFFWRSTTCYTIVHNVLYVNSQCLSSENDFGLQMFLVLC